MDSAAFSEYFECHSHSVDGVERSKHAAMKRKLEGRREVAERKYFRIPNKLFEFLNARTTRVVKEEEFF